MPEDQAKEQSQEEVVEGSGLRKKLLIIVIVSVVIVGISGYFVYRSFMGESPEPEVLETEGAEEHKDEQAEGELTEEEKQRKEDEKVVVPEVPQSGDVITLAPFQVNLADPYQSRYLQMKIALEFLPNKNLEEEIKQKNAKIRDTIISFASTTTRKELMTSEGKMKLRVSILNNINSFLRKGAIKQLYFTEFIID